MEKCGFEWDKSIIRKFDLFLYGRISKVHFKKFYNSITTYCQTRESAQLKTKDKVNCQLNCLVSILNESVFIEHKVAPVGKKGSSVPKNEGRKPIYGWSSIMSPQVFPLKLNRTIENQIALSFDASQRMYQHCTFMSFLKRTTLETRIIITFL